MPADLEAVSGRPQVIGVVDRPGRKPAEAVVDEAERFEFVGHGQCLAGISNLSVFAPFLNGQLGSPIA